MALSPTGSFSGTTTGSSSAGLLSLASLRIISGGTFTIQASATSITTGTSSSLTIANYVHSMTLTSPASTTSPTMNFNFVLTATLLAEDGTAFTGSCTVTLTESAGNLQGELSKANSGGTAAFTVYFNAIVTSRSIKAECPASGSYTAVSATISISTVAMIMKIGAFTPIVRNM